MEIKRTGAADYGQFVKALICGSPGSGKTLISSTWPNVLYANAEGGLMSVADRQVPYVDIRTSQDLAQLRSSLDQSPEVREQMFGCPVESVVIDTFDEVQRILTKERLKETRKEALVLQDWGWLGDQMRSIVRGFRNLDLHVIILVHVKETSDGEDGRLYWKPALQGAIADEIAGMVDLALLLKSRTVPKTEGETTIRVTERVLQTRPDVNHPWIKDRSGKLDEEVEVNFSDDFARLHEAIFSGIADLPATQVITPAVFEAPDVEDVSPPSPPTPQDKPVEAPREVESIDGQTILVDTETGDVVGKKMPNKPMAKAAQKADSSSAAAYPVCVECGVEVKDQDVEDMSRISFRKVLCQVHLSAAREEMASAK